MKGQTSVSDVSLGLQLTIVFIIIILPLILTINSLIYD